MPKDLPEGFIVHPALFEKLCKRMAKRVETFLALDSFTLDQSGEILTNLFAILGGFRRYLQLGE